MFYYYPMIVFIFGLLVGSFLNVVILRLPAGESIVKPRSYCRNCKKTIRALDNIPVLSYVLLKGKCRYCKAHVSARYPVVELIVGLCFLAVFKMHLDFSILFFRDLVFVSILVVVTFIDLDHRIIPDSLSLGGWVFGLVTSFFSPIGFTSSLIGGVLGFGIFYAFAYAYERWSQKSGLGGGDIKLLGMIGSFLGFSGVFFTILMSSILGSVVGIAWAYAQKEKDVMGVAIPYGPFLVIGALVYYFFGEMAWFQILKPL